MELILSLVPWILIFGVFWFFLIRPQKKQQKEHQDMLSNLQVGDKIVTAGGIKGKIVKIKDNIVRLRVSSNVDIDLLKSSISHIDKSEDDEENDDN
ncbi:preprotein translocase subunit YajC [Halanaerobiaceae bacterium Z-7014]|uniref:Preprotein translocase subunit YajC n=1 Tax=Halonatronomonas betaini TaxID=2778430 RepID=A0A931AWF6_9FIRM|nr:preprotein translocase subunit YajC [Halonatronomonas betaini]MBF8436043.1 preprotein translocase subunit YajC [Halonatronomonas betaini]